MPKVEKQPQVPCQFNPAGDREAIEHLKNSIAQGKHWYIALLEAIRLWASPEENYNGRNYRYLISGEAFDWLLLGERLLKEVDSLLPEEERDALLFFGKPPIELTSDEFRDLIGSAKHHTHLNYLYGVSVEEALILAVEEEVRKERRAFGYLGEEYIIDEVYKRIYGEGQEKLLRKFRGEKGYPQRKSTTISELKEFTYWLFRYRLEKCDKARVASDTRKALDEFRRQQALKERRGMEI